MEKLEEEEELFKIEEIKEFKNGKLGQKPTLQMTLMKKLFLGLASKARLLHTLPNAHKYIGFHSVSLSTKRSNIKCPPELHSTISTNQETVEASLVLNATIVANFQVKMKSSNTNHQQTLAFTLSAYPPSAATSSTRLSFT
jgi:hypothetical protein